MMLSDKVYNVLKWLCLIGLPAVGTLYYALSGVWNFPLATEICGTITIVCTFIGTLIGISTVSYKDNSNG